MEPLKTLGIVVKDYTIGGSSKEERERVDTTIAIFSFAVGAFATFRLFSRDWFKPNLYATAVTLSFGAAAIDVILPTSTGYLRESKGKFPALYWTAARPFLRGLLTLSLYFALAEGLFKNHSIGKRFLSIAAATVGGATMAAPFLAYRGRGVRDPSSPQ